MIKKLAILSILTIAFAQQAAAQNFYLKPYAGYATVRMNDANEDMAFRVGELQKQVQQALPTPDKLNGNWVWGVQLEYHQEGNYFFNLNTWFFREKTATDYSKTSGTPQLEYHYDRQIELFDLGVGMHYYFGYSSWKRVNTYLGAGFGVGFGWLESNFAYLDDVPQNQNIDNHGDFSAATLTAVFNAGGIVRLIPEVFLQGEVGFRLANMDQLDGKLRTTQGTFNDLTTEASYDFSGFYATAGIGFRIPLFK
jgi:hypothetical protein